MEIALVTGASRGVGRGVAISLAESGFQVFATGRSILTAKLPDSIHRIRCDHLRDDETAAAFARVAEAGPLDLLVNSAWGGYQRMVEGDRFTWPDPFWEQPAHRWTSMMDAGVRAARDPALMERAGKVLVAATLAAKLGVRDIDGRQPSPLTLETVLAAFAGCSKGHNFLHFSLASPCSRGLQWLPRSTQPAQFGPGPRREDVGH